MKILIRSSSNWITHLVTRPVKLLFNKDQGHYNIDHDIQNLSQDFLSRYLEHTGRYVQLVDMSNLTKLILQVLFTSQEVIDS